MPELSVPGDSSAILLHCCCAPCSGAIVEHMVRCGLRPVLFFSNSNICSRQEYELRKRELERYACLFGLEVVDDDYNHGEWLDFGGICNLAGEPERGARCTQCFRFRLLRAARYASLNGLEVLTTTLASSRWKDLSQVNAAGLWACEQVALEYPDRPAPSFWQANWRKGGLQPRRSEIVREQNFYNQTFCGCEFSISLLP